jgi:hypothetical protein
MGTNGGLVAYRQGGVILPRVLDLNQDGKLQMPTEVGKTYQLQAVSDMSASPDWASSGDPVAGTGDMITWDITMAGEQHFYWVKISRSSSN